MMSALLDKVRLGLLKPHIHRRFTFEQASDALAMFARRNVIGKCILVSERGFAESGETANLGVAPAVELTFAENLSV